MFFSNSKGAEQCTQKGQAVLFSSLESQYSVNNGDIHFEEKDIKWRQKMSPMPEGQLFENKTMCFKLISQEDTN